MANRRKVTLLRSAKSLANMTLEEIAAQEENNRCASAERLLPELDFVERLRGLYHAKPKDEIADEIRKAAPLEKQHQ